MKNAAKEALDEIAIIAHLTTNLITPVLPEGLTLAQYHLLNHVSASNTPLTISEIAMALCVSQPTMSSTVKKLEKKGFTRRLSDDVDGRAKRVHITNMGRRAYETSSLRINKLFSTMNDISAWNEILPNLAVIRSALAD